MDRKVLWVGVDDGNLQVSRDGGKSWTEVSRNVRGVPDGTQVSRVTGSVTARHVLPHPITAQGPFVAPGTYRVTLEAGSMRQTKDVVVKPDPLMPMISQRDYEERERFLVELQALQPRAAEAAQSAARQRITQVRNQLNGLASEFNGNAVRPGSLYPPGPDHRRRRADLERALTEALAQAGDGR